MPKKKVGRQKQTECLQNKIEDHGFGGWGRGNFEMAWKGILAKTEKVCLRTQIN